MVAQLQTTKGTRQPLMSAQEARSFQRYSVMNASHIKSALACGCEPYEDVFTYRRWLALGCQVRRGEKAVKIAIRTLKTWTDKETQEEKTGLINAGAAVFCRCQVEAVKV
ncbi:MAG: ArdC-like ssDNA-binding domain-containing protein [Dehalococcoidia bacterium]|nr:ArdC-like ssDNA-binding domain-containing protein [Dehalococcoidia bacterium]